MLECYKKIAMVLRAIAIFGEDIDVMSEMLLVIF